MSLRLVAISTVLSVVSSLFTPNQRVLGPATDRYQIPGGSPWRHCVNPLDHLFKIESAGMDPNPCMVYAAATYLPQIASAKSLPNSCRWTYLRNRADMAAVKAYAKSISPAL